MTRIFVYGSLKRGHDLAPLLAGSEFLGPAATAPQYRLVDLGEFPGLVNAGPPGSGLSVEGELYQVDAAVLAALDKTEGVPVGLYARRPVALAPPHDDAPAEAYFYLRPIASFPDCGPRWPRKNA